MEPESGPAQRALFEALPSSHLTLDTQLAILGASDAHNHDSARVDRPPRGTMSGQGTTFFMRLPVHTNNSSAGAS